MQRGFVYLCAVLDWASHRVLAWRLSNTLTTDFYPEAVQDTLAHYGMPEIFNTDQGASSPARVLPPGISTLPEVLQLDQTAQGA